MDEVFKLHSLLIFVFKATTECSKMDNLSQGPWDHDFCPYFTLLTVFTIEWEAGCCGEAAGEPDESRGCGERMPCSYSS